MITDNQLIELLAAAILSTARDAHDYKGTVRDLFDRVRIKWPGNYSEAELRTATEILSQVGHVVFDDLNDSAGFLRVNTGLLIAYLNQAAAKDKTPTLYSYSHFGDEWLATKWQKSFPPEEPAADLRDQRSVIPASDRIVNLDDNNPQLAEIREATQDLVIRLENNNDLGELNESEAIVAIEEVKQLAELLRQPLVRLSAIKVRAIDTLTWIGAKAAEAVVGAAAVGLLALIASHFGFSL